MNTAKELLHQATAMGITISVENAGLRLRGPSPYPGDLIDAIRHHKPQLLSCLSKGSLADEAIAWAGKDTKRWSRIFTALKKDWDPTSSNPRTHLVTWAGMHLRLSEAESAIAKFQAMTRLKPKERVVLKSREADRSFYSRASTGLLKRACVGLAIDDDTYNLLEGLVTKEDSNV